MTVGRAAQPCLTGQLVTVSGRAAQWARAIAKARPM
jgi:hypothetical protein